MTHNLSAIILYLLCALSFSQLLEKGLTQTQRDNLLLNHNDFRSQVANGLQRGIQASNMKALAWDTTVEAAAQSYANTCPSAKSTDKKYPQLLLIINYGPNQPSLAGVDMSTLFGNWKSSSRFFKNTTALVDSAPSFFTFSYLSWADFEGLGCGISLCLNSNYYLNLICNYRSPTPMRLYDPYWLRGAPCSACQNGRTCSAGLCVGPPTPTVTPPIIVNTPVSSLPTGTYGPMSDNIIYTTTSQQTPISGRKLVQSGITGNQRQQLIDAHNQKRQLVASGNASPQPGATNMLLMVYDSRDEYIPIDWAKTCPDDHNPNRKGYGENLYWQYMHDQPSLAFYPVSKAVDAWYNEIQYMDPKLVYDLGQAWAQTNGAIGHYTQVVWANSNTLLCGLSVCEYTPEYPWMITIACNYGPKGNFAGTPVYLEGSKCSSCPYGTACIPGAYDALCSPI